MISRSAKTQASC